jgi:hypothetical protein
MNNEGYSDPTADTVIGHVTNEQRKRRIDQETKTIKTLQNVAHLAGFDIVGRIELREHKSGRIYR